MAEPRAHSATAEAKKPAADSFGVALPWSEPYWYQGYNSPFYKETHKRFRAKVREFVDKEILPFIGDWEEAGDYPPELREKAYKAGIYAAIYPPEYGGTPPEQFDAFHDLILVDELARCGSGGLLFACFFSFAIALPPILAVGSQYLKDKVARDVLTGKKIMALAITEPWAGSDVAAIRTTARREGNFYIVNGEKKFITSANKAHYFTAAVRTGGQGVGGISLLLIESNTPGITLRRQKTQGWWVSGTTYITFDEVRVPAENLIGKENQGFLAIMRNFNHERFVGVVGANRQARCCLEEAIAYARVRETFGQKLIEHQVIRHKLADMARRVEANHALIEQVAYQIATGVDDRLLGGQLALIKVNCSQTFEYCAREASQILGGNSCLRTGVGAKVERLYRDVRIESIGGGSEEIMKDLAVRQARL